MARGNGKDRVLLVKILELPSRGIIAGLAFVISVITALVLVWNGIETRSHYRKIIAPQVMPYITVSPSETEWGIFLRNHGSGPATITLEEMFIDGEVTDPIEVVKQAVQEQIVTWKEELRPVRRLMGEKLFLKEGGESRILVFHPDTVPLGMYRKFEQFVHDRVDVKYTWCSVYNECQSACTSISCTP